MSSSTNNHNHARHEPPPPPQQNNNNAQYKLMKLIQIRDNKRNQMQELFAQKKKIMETMNTLNKELMSLDDDINILEDQQQQQQHNNGDYTTTMMTCNPEEILTEPTQTQQQQTQFESSLSGELLTDPLTSYTQTQQYQEPSSSGRTLSR